MVNAEFTPHFKKAFSKVSPNLRERILKQLEKLDGNPEIGKPMRYARKGTREVYIGSFRISYSYVKEENKLVFLDIYHKDKQ